MGGSSKDGPEMEVTEYSMSVHAGVCATADAILGLYFGERAAWEGDETDNVVIPIFQPELFGGPKKEGGIIGMVYWLRGDENQVLDEELAARLGKTSATCPGFRGLSSVFCVGYNAPITMYLGPGKFASGLGAFPGQSPDDEFQGSVGGWLLGVPSLSAQLFGRRKKDRQRTYNKLGMIWSYNNPYLKTFWVKVRRAPKGLDEELAMIPNGDSDNLSFDANPAHIIYECLTNADWGMGSSPGGLDTASFLTAAQTLFDEGFGLSLPWVQQARIEEFIGEVLDHIQGTVFVNPRTGLLTIKLLRDDYDRDDPTIPHFDESNCKLSDFQRKNWGETVNEIAVTWTNPINEAEETVTIQELGNVMAQGGTVIADSRNYHGIRRAELAAQVAQRDVRTAAAPLSSCVIECDRTAWDITPGSIVRVSNLKNKLFGVFFRVSNVDYGKVGQPRIRLSLLEDIFGYRVGAYFTPPSTQHDSGQRAPTPMTNTRIFTVPSFFVRRSGQTPEEPEVFAGVLGNSSNTDARGFELMREHVAIDGVEEFQGIGEYPLTARLLSAALPAEAETLTGFPPVIAGVGPLIGGFGLIGDGDEANTEIVFFADTNDEGGWIVKRGMLDTTPRAWPINTPVWFIDTNTPSVDPTEHVAGEIGKWKLLTQTSRGKLTEADAPEVEYELTERPYLPNRPANVRANDQGFGEVNAIEAPDIVITWANRNREMEDAQVLAWDDPGVVAEVGQTTTVILSTADGTEFARYDGLAGETYTLDPYDYDDKTIIRVRVISELDGKESLQGHELLIRCNEGGYGFSYGQNYGG